MDFYTDTFIRGKNVHLRGWKDGKRVHQKIEYAPYLFLNGSEVDTKYKSIHGHPLQRIDFDNIYEAKDFLKKYSGTSGMDIYGLDKFVYTFLNDRYQDDIQYSPSDLNIGSIDIECDTSDGMPDIQAADKEINAITLKKGNVVCMFGFQEYEAPEGVMYFQCSDEKDLLRKFLKVWIQFDLDIITGWNIEFFDIPYIVKRLKQVLGEDLAKQLSPWGILEDKQLEIFGKEQTVYYPKGVVVLDYMQLYKKFTYQNQESFKLDHIAWVELGEKKVDYSEYGSLHGLYVGNYKKFLDYNLQDVLLIDKLEDKLKLIELALTVAYDAKINITDVFTSVRLWDTIIHNHMIKDDVIVSPENRNQKSEQFAGAYVKNPLLGFFKDVVSFDYEALYPSIIIQYNISPETYRGKISDHISIRDILDTKSIDSKITEYLLENNLTMTANGCLWDRSKKGVFPTIIEKMGKERRMYKNLMLEAEREFEKTGDISLKKDISKYNNLQMARKIQLNSLYGALGNKWCRWFSIAFAEAITLTGQLSIQWVTNDVNAFISKATGIMKDRLIAVDTDSVVGESIITVNGSKISIADYYESCPDVFLKNDSFNENYVKSVLYEAYTPSVSKDGMICNNKIKHIMKHKVKKEFFKITVKNKSVIVTEDHSIIVQNRKTKKIYSVKPKKLNYKLHNIINICS